MIAEPYNVMLSTSTVSASALPLQLYSVYVCVIINYENIMG